MPGYETAYDLLARTGSFYQDVARVRLDHEFQGVDAYMRPYFRKRWNVDKDLYAEAIERNLEYLDKILSEHSEDLKTFLGNLRRDFSICATSNCHTFFPARCRTAEKLLI